MRYEQKMKKRLLLLLLILIVPAIYVADVLMGDPLADLPPLQSGDIVFQTTYTPQAMAIMWASKSLYDHVGIVVREPNGVFVIEAAATIVKTPLPQWVNRGKFKRLTILRDPRLSTRERQQIVDAAESYLGRPYDYFFLFDTDTIYCSELVYHAYHNLDKSIGQVERVGTLDVDNYFVDQLLRQRWQKHPLCQGGAKIDFETCRGRIMNQKLITPASIARDGRLEVVYDNYPF